MMTEAPRSLVLHADDFGMNPAVNAGILQAFREGLLTSTSLLVNAPDADRACRIWRELDAERARGLPSTPRRAELGDATPPFDLGIHLNLTQGRPLTRDYPASLCNERGEFPGIVPVFQRLRREAAPERGAVREELQAQIEWMIEAGLRPTHLNGHQYIELIPGVAELIPDLLKRYQIPVVRVARESGLSRTVLGRGRVAGFGVALVKRYFAGRFQVRIQSTGVAFPARFFGTSHAGEVTPRVLRGFLKRAAAQGCTEIGLHPATETDRARSPEDAWYDPLTKLRPQELNWLCDPATVRRIASRQLVLGRLQSLGREKPD